MTFLTWSNSSFQISQQMLEIFFQSSEDFQEERSFSEESAWLGLFLCFRPLIAELKHGGESGAHATQYFLHLCECLNFSEESPNNKECTDKSPHWTILCKR